MTDPPRETLPTEAMIEAGRAALERLMRAKANKRVTLEEQLEIIWRAMEAARTIVRENTPGCNTMNRSAGVSEDAQPPSETSDNGKP